MYDGSLILSNIVPAIICLMNLSQKKPIFNVHNMQKSASYFVIS